MRIARQHLVPAVVTLAGAATSLGLGVALATFLQLPPDMAAPDAVPDQSATFGELASIETAVRNAADNPPAPPPLPPEAPVAADQASLTDAEDAQAKALDRQIAHDLAATAPVDAGPDPTALPAASPAPRRFRFAAPAPVGTPLVAAIPPATSRP